MLTKASLAAATAVPHLAGGDQHSGLGPPSRPMTIELRGAAGAGHAGGSSTTLQTIPASHLTAKAAFAAEKACVAPYEGVKHMRGDVALAVTESLVQIRSHLAQQFYGQDAICQRARPQSLQS